MSEVCDDKLLDTKALLKRRQKPSIKAQRAHGWISRSRTNSVGYDRVKGFDLAEMADIMIKPLGD